MNTLKNAAAAHMEGNIHRAKLLYLQALEENHDDASAWQMLAVLHFEAGATAEAKRCNGRALALDPGSAAALNTAGNIEKSEGQLDEAVSSFERSLALAPDLPQALTNLSDCFRLLGRLDEAILTGKKAVQLAPDLAAAHGNLAAIQLDSGDAEAAAVGFALALDLAPADNILRINLARALARKGDRAGAQEYAALALEYAGDDAEKLNALASVYFDLGNLETAEELVRSALAGDPDLADARNNLGNILTCLGKPQEGIAEFKRALENDAKNAGYLTNLGGAQQAAGYLAAAMDSFEIAISIESDHADAHWNRGLARLLSGDLTAGFADYEWRWRLPEFRPRHQDIPGWSGGDLQNLTLLIHSEQGYGDTIQFVRYASLLSEQGAQVILETHAPLRRLLQSVPGVNQVLVRGEPLPDTSLQVPILSLPHIIATTLETVPSPIPYLHPPADETIDMGGRVDGVDTRVGIAWSGRPSHKNDRNRSCSLSHFRPLSQIPGVRLFSLQLGDKDWELDGDDIVDLAPQLEDFAATAAAIARLDLIVSVDTAVAHLAGAMGKPCWLILPFAPDWRWLLDRHDSPWYPSHLLFRQESPGDWSGVMKRVAEKLAAFSNQE
ncbi:MAG: tetratricopeptide repeat protein [Pseudomonadota bacterium]|nr:tetratricopeptide repeat protein [Pseudomonadota bacterium]